MEWSDAGTERTPTRGMHTDQAIGAAFARISEPERERGTLALASASQQSLRRHASDPDTRTDCEGNSGQGIQARPVQGSIGRWTSRIT